MPASPTCGSRTCRSARSSASGSRDDHRHIVATCELTRGAAALAVSDSRFWVERPRVGTGGVSGLGTLLSGAYIGVDVGTSTENAEEFTGLEKPPGVTRDQRGTRFRLTATDGGSLAVRSPVYLRRVAVGWVTDLALAPDGKTIGLEVFVQQPYDKDVTDHTVFWNASGLDLAVDAAGLKVDAQSLATVIAGGIAFDARDPNAPAIVAAENASYPLFVDRAHAMAIPDGLRLTARLRFEQQVRGIIAGTVVDFQGVKLGVVDDVKPGFDDATHELFFDVTASVFPERLGAAYATLVAENPGKTGPQALQTLVARGLRGQIRTGNLLTGQAYVELTWFPRVAGVAALGDPSTWVIPTVRGSVDQLQEQVQDIVSKLDKVPFDVIGQDVQGATHAASGMFGHLDQEVQQVAPEAQKMLVQAQAAMGALREVVTSLRDNVAAPDSAIQQSTRTTLEELDRAAYALRSLADYVEHHPESLVRGRAGGSEPQGSK